MGPQRLSWFLLAISSRQRLFHRESVLLLIGVTFGVVSGPIVVSHGLIVPVLLFALTAAAIIGIRILDRPFYGLALLTLVLTFFPIAKIQLGNLPLYLSDILIATTLVGLLRRGPKVGNYPLLVLIYLALWLPAWIYQVARLEIVLEPTYGMIRNMLAVGSFFIGWMMADRLRSPEFRTILYTGLLATSALTVLQVMPLTSDLIRMLLFSTIPDSAEVSYRVYPSRAFGFFLAPTGLSGFMAMMLPLLVADLLKPERDRSRLTGVTILAVLLTLIATVSRQWVPAALIGFLAMVWLRPRTMGKVSGAFIGSGLLIGLLFALGLLESSYLVERFSRLSSPSEDPNVTTRLQRLIDFIHYAAANPMIVLIGNGFATQDLVERGVVVGEQAEELRAGYSDNSFLLELWHRGLAAALLYVGLLIGALRLGIRASRRVKLQQPIIVGLTSALLVGITLHFIDNYFSEAIFIKAWFWLLLGWLVAEASRTLSGEVPQIR